MKYDPERGGTEVDGAKSSMYCSYCYKNGEFTMDATAEEMQAFCTEQKRKMGIPRLFAWLTSLCIPKLQRWKNAPPSVKPAPKYDAALIAVKDMAVSKKFYREVLGQKVVFDLGKNVSFKGGFALHEGFDELVDAPGFKTTYGPNDHELYFEEDELDAFIERLKTFEGIELIHEAKEYPWGQRVVRFYDPDRHVIEVGESMDHVVRRLLQEGKSVEEVAEKTMFPVPYVNVIAKTGK